VSVLALKHVIPAELGQVFYSHTRTLIDTRAEPRYPHIIGHKAMISMHNICPQILCISTLYIYGFLLYFDLCMPMKCREVDTVDLRRKLPYAVGVLHRLLRMCHRVYVTCTTGLDRSPTCVIAYLHWIQDVSLPRAYDFVTAVHPSGPDR
jgi:hypothetical protein